MSGSALPRSLQDNPALGRWLSLELPGKVLIRSGKVELGQGILTALVQIVAEELGIAINRIEVQPADTDVSPDEGFTAGSQSVEVSGASLRHAAACARAELIQAAARRSGVDASELSCENGAFLKNGAPLVLDFWTVAADVDWSRPVGLSAKLRSVADYSIIGSSLRRIDLRSKLARGGFIHDLVLEGMKHARVIRQPFRLAQLAEVDGEWLARRHPAVGLVRKADFLALLGTDEFSVHSAQADAEHFVHWAAEPLIWRPPETAVATQTVVAGAGIERATSNAGLKARYARGYIAHGSIGPSCALAHLHQGRLTVWSHSQGIFALKGQIARCLDLNPANVRVIHAHGAGCYGHNGADDAALDAAIIAVARPGTPVRVQWSRADELSRGPLGAAMSAEVEATLDAKGYVSTWSMSVVSAPHAQRPGGGGYANLTSAEALDATQVPRRVEDLPVAAGGGASRNAAAIYDFPDHLVRVTLDASRSIRTSSLRSLGAHLNVFAIESAMDELAELADVDPIDFRLRHLTDERCRAVLEGVAAMSGWPDAKAIGEGRALGVGVARYKNKGAWLAAVAKVSVDETVRVERLWLCVDAGLLINPIGARNQIEGGALQAMSWTLKEAVPIANDRVPLLDWESYPILHFSEVPEVETRFIVDTNQPPLGAGEAAQGPVAAAIGNAASKAVGARMRDMPLTRDRIIQVLMDG